MFDIGNIPFDDPNVWRMICEGRTKGCFQIESHLGKTWCKKIKPTNIEELADVISIVRPGALKAKVDGKTIANHYADRRDGKDEIKAIHPSIVETMSKTQGVFIYQETILKVAQIMAKFDMKQLLRLQKGIGKKDQKVINELHESFVSGAVKNGISKEIAEDVFSAIQKSGRYLFNKCLSPATLVELESGEFVTIEAVQIGQMIKTPSGYSKVIDKHYNGKKELFRVTLQSGREITCSSEHKFLCEDGRVLPLYEIRDEDLQIVTDSPYMPEYIYRVVRIGEEDCMDLEIEDPHIFYGNGIATSNSHACEYAIEAYKSAYLKTYHPLLYFKNWLRHADEKTKPDIEVKQLVSAAKSEEIGVKPPSVLHLKENFFLDGENIRFGICNVKNVGRAHLDRLISLKVDERKTWIETLFFVLPEVNKRAVEGLINVGAFSHLGVSRTQMKHEFACIEKVNEKELDWIRLNFIASRSIADHILMAARTKKEGGACHNISRVEKLIDVSKRLQNPGRSLSDSPIEYAKAEEDLLGVAICHSELSACADACHANAKCKELTEGRSDTCTIAVVIKAVKTHITKKKEEMAFLEVEDDSGELDNVVVFSNVYAIESPIIYEESTVLLTGRLNERGDSKSFVVESVYQI